MIWYDYHTTLEDSAPYPYYIYDIYRLIDIMYIDKLNWCKHIDKLNKLGRSLIEWALLPRNIRITLNSLCPCFKVSAAVREDIPRLQMGLIKCKKETTTFWALGRSTFPKKMKDLPKILQNSSVSNFGPFWARFGP